MTTVAGLSVAQGSAAWETFARAQAEKACEPEGRPCLSYPLSGWFSGELKVRE